MFSRKDHTAPDSEGEGDIAGAYGMGLYIAMCMETSKGSRRELEMFLPLAWVVQVCVCHVELCYVVLCWKRVGFCG